MLIFELEEERIDRKCAAIKEQLLVLQNHKHEMPRDKVVTLCEDIMFLMIDLIELLDSEQ